MLDSIACRTQSLLKSILVCTVFILTLVAAATTFAQSTLSSGPVDLTPQEAAQLLQENPDIVILDVRTPVEFYVSHIENAININYYSFSFKSKIKKLDPNKTYLVHCQTGVRSGKTIPIMVEAGFTRVYHLTDGFKAWKDASLPTT